MLWEHEAGGAKPPTRTSDKEKSSKNTLNMGPAQKLYIFVPFYYGGKTMVSDEFVAAAKEWHDKRLTYFDFFSGLPEGTRVRAITLFCLHKDCDMRTVELLFRAYTGEFDYLLTEKAMPILPSREAYFESRRETRGLVEEIKYANLYQCPKFTGT